MIAVVIPFFKETYFNFTLESLKNQTCKDFKVYIGDDSSPSNIQSLLDFYDSYISIKYVKFQSNMGGTDLAQHWNRCLDLVENEEWIMVLGDDDFLDDDVILDQNYYNEIEIIFLKNKNFDNRN